MKGHKEAISGIVWSEKVEVITCSWDHTIKVWDSELGGIKHDLAGNKSFFDIDYSPLSRAVITASADRHIRLYDPRSTGGLEFLFGLPLVINSMVPAITFRGYACKNVIHFSHTMGAICKMVNCE